MAKPRLLIADADPRSRRILEMALRKAGFSVAAVADGIQALQRVLATPPDLLVSEASLPSTDGLAVCKQARAALPALPIVVIGKDPALAARALEAGADEFLRKPIVIKELVRRAQALLLSRERAGEEPLDASRGSLRDLGLVAALQALAEAKKSAVVSCEVPGRSARLWVREGQVVDAELGALLGEDAFFRLMTWESGSFRVDPQAVDREPRIEGGTEALLVEALRRAEQLASQELPMNAVFAVDFPRLADQLSELPDEVNGVLRCFDGKRTLREAIDLSPVEDSSTLQVVRRLLNGGVLRAVSSPDAPPKPSLEDWLSDPPPAAARVMVVRFPPLRGVRRERLRREAEEARTRIVEGKAVRLSRVVELPPCRADGADALTEARRMSPAVGESARKFAPDAPVARLLEGGRGPQGAAPAAAPIAAPAATHSGAPAKGQEPVVTPPIAPAHALEPLATPPIAPAHAPEPVATPPVAPVAQVTPPPGSRNNASQARRRWLWAAAALAVLAGTGFFLLRPQPPTDKKDAPWLGPAAAAKAPSAAARAPPALDSAPPDAKSAPSAASSPPASGSAPPSESSAPSAVSAPRGKGKAGAAPAPDRYDQALELGEHQLRGGKYKLAIAQLQRAVKERPKAVPALVLLGDAYLEADKPRSALQPLQEAARLDPKSSRARLLLGTAWQSLGKNAQARAAYLGYLELEPQGEYARDVRQILANLGR